MPADFGGLSDEARNSLMPALDELRRAGIKFNVTSAFRSPEKQAALYANRASNPYPVAPPGSSTHEKGLAADIALTDEKQRDKATQILTSHGWNWRLGAKDRVHYEYDPKSTAARIPAFNEKPAEYVPPFRPAKAAPAADLIPSFKAAPAAKGEMIPEFIPAFKPAAARPTNPNVRLDAKTGRAIDPVSGKPFPARGTPVEARQSNFDEKLIEGTTALAVGAQGAYNRALNRATAGLAPAREIANSVTREIVASKKKYGRAENEPGSVAGLGVLWRGVTKSHPWTAFVDQLSKGQATNLQVFEQLKDDPTLGPIIKKTPGGAATLDFLLTFPLDHYSGTLQGKIAGGLGKGIVAADQKLGASEAALNRMPKVKAVVEGRKVYQQASQIMSRHAAGMDRYLRQAEEAAEDLRATSQKYGVAKLRGGNPYTRKPTNLLDQLVADWLDAGAPGSKHEHIHGGNLPAPSSARGVELAAVTNAARSAGIDYADVERIGMKYRQVMDALGQHLVYAGLLDASAYRSLQGSYLPRLYVLTKGDPEDVAGFLQLMEEQGAMTPEAIRAARQRLGPKGFAPSASPKVFNQQREITVHGERTALGRGLLAVPEATPAFTGYTAAATKAAGRAAGHAEIALTPELALPVDRAPSGWRNYTGKGPLEGYAVHPAVDNLLKFQDDPGMVVGYLQRLGKPEAARKYQQLSSFVKRVWVSSPKTALNNIGGNVALGDSTAAMHGGGYSLPGYARAAKQMMAAGKGGKVPSRLQEALDHTSILRDSALQVPQGARSIAAGFGVETRLERLKALPSKLFNAYGNSFYNLPEKAGRYYLYDVLRGNGLSIQQAEKIVNDAMITYTDVGPIVRELERNPLFGAPFITFPLKAVATYAKTAALRPDKLNTYTGQRLRQFLDAAADEERRRQGLEPVAARKRAAGEVGPFEFPLPGQSPEGKQRYLRAPGLAPFAQGMLSNRGGPPTENLLERIKGVNPLSNLITGLATNENQFTGQPIVPVGSIPGTAGDLSDIFRSSEAAGKYGMQVARAILPEAGDLERIFKSVTGATEYESMGADVPELKGTLLRAFTGMDLKPTIGQNKLELAFRLKKRLEELKPTMETQFASNYVHELFTNRRQLGPQWVARPDFLQMAARYDDKKLNEAMQNAGDRLNFVITKDNAKPEERQRKVREMLDWIWALGIAQQEKVKGQASFLQPQERAPFEGMLGGR